MQVLLEVNSLALPIHCILHDIDLKELPMKKKYTSRTPHIMTEELAQLMLQQWLPMTLQQTVLPKQELDRHTMFSIEGKLQVLKLIIIIMPIKPCKFMKHIKASMQSYQIRNKQVLYSFLLTFSQIKAYYCSYTQCMILLHVLQIEHIQYGISTVILPFYADYIATMQLLINFMRLLLAGPTTAMHMAAPTTAGDGNYSQLGPRDGEHGNK